jgi:ribose-phosphate pyrophosphokinase
MGDDMIVTGSTLIRATEALLGGVPSSATHALFAQGALDRLRSGLAKIIVTDSVRIPAQSPKLTVLSVAGVLADTIDAVFANRSVSALFAGQELF